MNSFFARKFVVQGIFISITIILLMRLFYIQVISDEYILSAENNVIRRLPIYPARGVILDRNKNILVQNEPVYDLMVIPREVKPFDTIEFCNLIGIDKTGFDRRFKRASSYSPYKASIFEKQLSVQVYASFQEKLSNFSGFFVQNRTVRRYPDSIAAHFLGYIGEVNQKVIENSKGFYTQGDYHGITGVERSYEELLRGQRGVQNLMVDALNRPKGNYADGKYDTVAVAGEHMISSLDKDLQKLGEQLMKNKIGSIVAIEPSTGEILSFVSSPGYDPNLMVGRQRGNNYMALLNDTYKPMFVRPIQAEYPPGSIFKVVNALVAQQFGSINENTYFFCPGGYRYGRQGFMGCTHVHGSIGLKGSITESCNTYYGYTYARMIDQAGMRPVNAYKKWRTAVSAFGIGTALGIDLPGERNGLLPEAEYYTKRFKNDKWGSPFTISLSIGQGELGITPLQMANVMAIVANRGFFYKPHLIKAIGDKNVIKEEYLKKNSAGIDPQYFDVIIDGMSAVVNQPSGTAWYSRIPEIEMCGKTGTVQNPHGKDHSVFVAFAPRENPKIAIAVVVENAGFGSTWSAPIASLMVEKYINKKINRPKAYMDRLMDANLLPGSAKVIRKPDKDSTNNKTVLTEAKVKSNE
ncbi:MAG: penicillin-binding protein 2 [Daejeonella sp.]|uniref:penicillin-binding protein 2 n=1 Tax=Daejeonella sp. TaxID=2805397 RepID=UPI00273279E6|nr:penicillin-binding protein 2 [Daejeonella sp.]MDP3468603.1 penicillin-binding protein 2 [Daejeonella sp.]